MRVQVNGDLSVSSSNIYAANAKSKLYVKTKYLEATAGAISNQMGVSSDLAMVNKKMEVGSIAKNASRQILPSLMTWTFRALWALEEKHDKWVNKRRLHKNRS